ncbi:MAG TPA: M23 family metallopeptidase [Chitinophagales bacterium]|nr:M23 family metallopeptidase [Chitinophagales bacterium]
MKLLLSVLVLPFLLLLNTSFNAGRTMSVTGKPVKHLADTLISPKKIADEKYFGRVLDIATPSIVGNFGEPRRLHFHTGLDFRTNQEEGHVVFAAADGYVSRINVSGAGYGNALYITHPNGYVTVYGHLLRYNAKIMERLRREQYSKESFAVDFYPAPGEIPVRKGDTVALSGNTGGSGGPHLHFEIRDTTERVYNPMLFGYKLRDEVRPTVSYLQFYGLDELKNKSDSYRVKTFGKNGLYEVTGGLVKVNDALAGISINAFDAINNSDAHIGIYNITVFDGDRMIYEYQQDQIAFTNKRDVLSHTDYAIFMNESRRAFHKCFVEPGNHCPVYCTLANSGVINLSDGKVHQMHIEVSDFSGNVSLVRFGLQYDKASTLLKPRDLKYTTLFSYDTVNVFSTEDIKMRLPVGTLFDNVFFRYSSALSTDPKVYSRVHELDNSNTQVSDWYDLSIKTENLPPALSDKAIVIFKDGLGSTTSRGGKFENGFITTKAREFGTYYVRIDTTAPTIKSVNVVAGKNMRASKKLFFKITDNLSGIADFDTYIDDKWTVTEYDAKTATLFHILDQKLPAGEHTFKIVVTDERKNRAEYSIKFLM